MVENHYCNPQMQMASEKRVGKILPGTQAEKVGATTRARQWAAAVLLAETSWYVSGKFRGRYDGTDPIRLSTVSCTSEPGAMYRGLPKGHLQRYEGGSVEASQYRFGHNSRIHQSPNASQREL